MSEARAAARTLVVGTSFAVPFFARLAVHRLVAAPSTGTPEGLETIRASFRRTLRRFGVELEVLHAERVPASGGLLFMWNQESHLDHLVLAAAIPRPFLSLYNNAVARVPFYGAHMRATGHFHVDRSDEAQWRASIARSAAFIRDGGCVLVSPEGTRSRHGVLLPMKRGAFLLASAAARPLGCLTVVGGQMRQPRGPAVVRPGPLRVGFSEPIPTADRSTADVSLEEAVASTFERDKARFAVA
jgi:1-acyl-sn-glycerol-3-phosphate acyltransferase